MSLSQIVVPLWLLAIAGCVTHAPMSEMTMFRDPATPVRHEKLIVGGVTATFIATSGATGAWIRRDDAAYSSEGTAPEKSSAAGVYVAMSDQDGGFGMALTLGFLPGVDITARLRGRTYLTVGYTLGHLFQGYLQHRAMNTRRLGAIVGFGARSELLVFDYPGKSILSFQTQRFLSVGGRAVILLRAPEARNLGFKVVGYVGFVPYVRRPVASLTLALGGI